MCLGIYVCASVFLAVGVSVCRMSRHLCVHVICLVSGCLCVCISLSGVWVSLCVYLSIVWCLGISLCVYLFVWCLGVFVCVCVFVYVCVRLSVCMYLGFWVYLDISVCASDCVSR